MAERRAEKTLDERFDEVSVAFAEMRDFTTFCFDKLGGELRAEMKAMEGSLSAQIGQVGRRLDRHDLLLGEILSEVKALRPPAHPES